MLLLRYRGTFTPFLSEKDVSAIQLGSQSALQTLASRAISIGLVRPAEQAFRKLLGAAIVAGMPADALSEREIHSLMQELKKMIRNRGKSMEDRLMPRSFDHDISHEPHSMCIH